MKFTARSSYLTPGKCITIYEITAELPITDLDCFDSLKVKIRAKKKLNAMS
jgi:hypothetical protein